MISQEDSAMFAALRLCIGDGLDTSFRCKGLELSNCIHFDWIFAMGFRSLTFFKLIYSPEVLDFREKQTAMIYRTLRLGDNEARKPSRSKALHPNPT